MLESRAEDALSKAAVNQLGVIEAQTLEGSAGSIRLVGDRIVGDVLLTGTLDASAPGGGDGGAISISGARVNIADSARISMAAGGQPGALAIDATTSTSSRLKRRSRRKPLLDLRPGTGRSARHRQRVCHFDSRHRPRQPG